MTLSDRRIDRESGIPLLEGQALAKLQHGAPPQLTQDGTGKMAANRTLRADDIDIKALQLVLHRIEMVEFQKQLGLANGPPIKFGGLKWS